MSRTLGPDLQVLMDKRLKVYLNGNRSVTGVLAGFDAFMNIVLDDCVAPLAPAPGSGSGSSSSEAVERLGSGIVIRGNSIVTIEPQEQVTFPQ